MHILTFFVHKWGIMSNNKRQIFTHYTLYYNGVRRHFSGSLKEKLQEDFKHH